MDLEELYKMWAADSEIDPQKVSTAAIDAARLHAKYLTLYTKASLRLRRLKGEHKQLLRDKTDWYKGEMAEEDMKALGWTPNPLRILRSDVNTYVDTDKDVINKVLQVGYQEEVAGFLEACLKSITNRNFLLKTIVDWEKFKAGG